MARRAPAQTASDAPEILSLEQQMVVFLAKARKLAVPVAVAIVAIVVVSIVVKNSREATRTAQASAQAALSEAMTDTTSPFSPPEARQKAAEDRLAKLRVVVAEHPGSQAATEAAFYIARTQYDLQQYDEAAKSFAEFAAAHPAEQPLAALAAMGEANALVDQEKYQEGLDKFTQIANPGAVTNDPELIARAKYRAALCCVALDKQDDARKFVQEIAASDVSSDIKDKAKALADKLGVIKASDLEKPVPKPEDEKKEDKPAASSNGGLQIVPMGGN